MHSALLVGLDKAKMMGRSLNDAMSRMISSVNACPIVAAPRKYNKIKLEYNVPILLSVIGPLSEQNRNNTSKSGRRTYYY